MEVLYHYCAPETFLSIIRFRSIWLSSMTQSNDSAEGEYALDLLYGWAVSNGVSTVQAQALLAYLRHGVVAGGCLGFCLSAKSDLLGQWRGYAKDGKGFSIGFARQFLESLCLEEDASDRRMQLCELAYTEESQLAALDAFCRAILLAKDQGILEHGDNLDELLVSTAVQDRESVKAYAMFLGAVLSASVALYTIKGPAFIEEHEWRLLRPESGSAGLHYRCANDQIIPYIQVDLTTDGLPPIREVILGPRQQTPERVVRAFLDQHGFHGVEIKRSSATYR